MQFINAQHDKICDHGERCYIKKCVFDSVQFIMPDGYITKFVSVEKGVTIWKKLVFSAIY